MAPEERTLWILAAKNASKRYVVLFYKIGSRVTCGTLTDSLVSILSKTSRKLRLEEKIDVTLYNTDGVKAIERRYIFECNSAAYCIPGIKREL